MLLSIPDSTVARIDITSRQVTSNFCTKPEISSKEDFMKIGHQILIGWFLQVYLRANPISSLSPSWLTSSLNIK